MMILMKETAQNPIQTSNKYNTTDAGLFHHNICFTNNHVHENKLYKVWQYRPFAWREKVWETYSTLAVT